MLSDDTLADAPLLDSPDVTLPPRLTADLPGTGGTLKVNPRDFEVEEIPAYEPSGTGEHLYLWLEKEGLSADALLAHVSRTLGVARRDIGCAGLKDTRAITRQYVSVPASAAAGLEALTTPQVRLLRSARHGNKLRTGHLRGNRFRVLVREPVADAAERVVAKLERLRRLGLPNYYGPQRFGSGGSTLQLGLRLLQGERVRTSGFRRRLAISAVQSALFNRYLAARLKDDLLHRVLAGDVMQVCASGGPFVAEAAELAREQARYEAHEIVTTGPMFGPKMRRPQDAAAAREAALLAAAQIDPAVFGRFGKLASGTRRPLLVWLDALPVEHVAEGLQLRFSLPPGSFATVLLAEVMT